MFERARRSSTKLFFALVTLLTAQARGDDAASKEVDFNRDIRPLLSDACFQCHGPDEQTREADLRLDLQDGLFAELDGHAVVKPRDPDASELLRRIQSEDRDERMPPPDSGIQLTAEQIALIERWIEQGARWQQHWSFVASRRPELPPTKQTDWCRNAIDHFVLARLEQEGLQPSPPADKATLIRRVTLDLTGLPPTPAEVDAFLADDSPDAYEKVVDRLLASPRYGERMAIRWLDAARYADTSGYQNDGPRDMWRWRDWVIDAYNHNMPFDQFTVEQLAGDLLDPELKFDSRGKWVIQDPRALGRVIATAFNRNHRGNAEGGIIPEEYQVEYVVDRVDTTATVFLGLTMGCARCHDHKYDPISQKEFYQVFAYFNSIPEYGRAIKEGNSPPYIKAPTHEQLRKLKELSEETHRSMTALRDMQDDIVGQQRMWEASLDRANSIDWTITDGLVAQFDFDGDLRNDVDRTQDATAEGGDAEFMAGKYGESLQLDGTRFVSSADAGNFGYFDEFTISLWVYPQSDGTILSRMTPEPRGSGYYLHFESGKLQFNMVKRWLDDSIRIETLRVRRPEDWENKWHHIAVTYDGSRYASDPHLLRGAKIWIDGQPQEIKINHDFLNQSFATDAPLRLGAGVRNLRGRIDDVRIYHRRLHTGEVATLATAESITEIADIEPEKRTLGQSTKIASYYYGVAAAPQLRGLHRRLRELRERETNYAKSLPTLMVMQEMDKPRRTFVLQRGEYNRPKERVEPGVPAVFPPLPVDTPGNRLGFARWLVDPANPLTGRVAVNWYWQMYFGTGIVATPEDFGSQGARPTHPELLDWLATEFVRCRWDVKAMQKLIVTSATYRQSSHVTQELLARDPDNALLARGPRLRLPAEVIRDQALAAAGLLHERIGGPSVKPYQPEGLWSEIATDTKYEQSTGGDLYRRSLYTYWKRTVTPPTMSTFDAPAREMCTVRQTRTNTPLQALALLNDVTYVEAARALAERVYAAGDDDNAALIERVFQLVLARKPTVKERAVLLGAYERYIAKFIDNPDEARAFTTLGEAAANPDIPAHKLAAMTAIASLILNLDEAVTKE